MYAMETLSAAKLDVPSSTVVDLSSTKLYASEFFQIPGVSESTQKLQCRSRPYGSNTP